MKGFKEKLLTGTLAFTMVLTSAAVQFNTTEVKADTAGSDYKLVWSDEFNGTALNTDNWTYDLEMEDQMQVGEIMKKSITQTEQIMSMYLMEH